MLPLQGCEQPLGPLQMKLPALASPVKELRHAQQQAAHQGNVSARPVDVRKEARQRLSRLALMQKTTVPHVWLHLAPVVTRQRQDTMQDQLVGVGYRQQEVDVWVRGRVGAAGEQGRDDGRVMVKEGAVVW